MLKRAAKWENYVGEHSSDDDTSSDEADPRIRAIFDAIVKEAAERGDSDDDSDSDDENNEEVESKKSSQKDSIPFCGVNKTVTLADQSQITYDGKKYVCSVCPKKDIWKANQVKLHIESKLHKKCAKNNLLTMKREKMSEEDVKALLEKKERKRTKRFQRNKLRKKAKLEKGKKEEKSLTSA
eukprot:CFRG3048T1